MIGNKEIGKWKGGCKYHAHFTFRQQRYRLIFWKLNFNWSDIKVKTKN